MVILIAVRVLYYPDLTELLLEAKALHQLLQNSLRLLNGNNSEDDQVNIGFTSKLISDIAKLSQNYLSILIAQLYPHHYLRSSGFICKF